MGGMGLFMLLLVVAAAAIIATAVYRALRAGRPVVGGQPEAPLETLQRRLAEGEITPEEYFERESALREFGAPRRGRRRS
jgi:uncharacterized membrane protein